MKLNFQYVVILILSFNVKSTNFSICHVNDVGKKNIEKYQKLQKSTNVFWHATNMIINKMLLHIVPLLKCYSKVLKDYGVSSRFHTSLIRFVSGKCAGQFILQMVPSCSMFSTLCFGFRALSS